MWTDRYLAIQVAMMPRDTNPHGTIFGGILLSYLDQAGAIGAAHAVIEAGGDPPSLVTVAMNRVEFLEAVLVGDVVRFYCTTQKIGKTSITVDVAVEVERKGKVIPVTQAEVIYVGVDLSSPERKPKRLLPA